MPSDEINQATIALAAAVEAQFIASARGLLQAWAKTHPIAASDLDDVLLQLDLYRPWTWTHRAMFGPIDDLLRDLLREQENARRASDTRQIETTMAQLHAMPYPEYLESEHWRLLSASIKDKAGNRCQTCNAGGPGVELNVHHRSYENRGLGAAEIADLVTLCRACHALFHGKPT